MRSGITVLSITLLIALVWISGCSNVSLGNAQVADFGTSIDAQKAQSWFLNQYGDPASYTGPPRFLEPMVSSGIVNNTPMDKVLKFSQNAPSVYFWVFYEGFKNGDAVTATWTYQGKQYATMTKKVGGNYGIINAQFDKPNSGWALGTHTITISGNGAQNSLTFEIIAGDTVTAPLPYKQEDLSSVSDRSPKNLGNAAPEDRSPVTKQSSSNDPAVGVLPDKRGSVERADHTMVSLCGPHQNIKNGECICDDPSMKACGKDCINQLVDSNNCGDCGNECGEFMTCSGGACVCLKNTLSVCNQDCVDLKSDPNNCGSCNNHCLSGGAEAQICVDGRCKCPKGWGLCSSGYCEPLNTPQNCHKCGNVCENPDYPFCGDIYDECVDANGYPEWYN